MSKRYPYYPVYLDVENRNAVIVGGGEVCARKAESLLHHGAAVTVVSPEVIDEIAAWGEAGAITIRRKHYEESDLEGAILVIASTDNQAVNEKIAADCRRRRIPVNVVDNKPLCDFIVPSVITSGSIQIAVSTGGRSPALARRLRKDLEEIVGTEYGEISDILGSLREPARATLPTDLDRKHFFDRIIDEGALDLLRHGKRDEAYALIGRICEEAGVPLPTAVREARRS